MKRCTKCKRLLDESEFNKDATRKDGLRCACKDCRGQEYRENRDKYLRQHAQYRETHREQLRQRQREYDAAHREEKRVRDREWQRQNPERCRAKTHRRRARLASLPADLTWEEWQEILMKYDHSCAYCEAKSKKLQQEHVTPVAQGGGYTRDNIVPACPGCNQRKGNRTPEEAGMKPRLSQQ